MFSEHNNTCSRPNASIRAVVISASLGASLILASGSAAQQEVVSFLEPYRTMELAPAEIGILRQLYVEEGEEVESGQLLAALEDSELRASLAIAQAAAQSRGRLSSAQAEVQLQAKQLEKLTELHARSHASEQELERAKMQLAIAEAQVLIAQEELLQRELDVNRIEAQIEKRRVHAPTAGVVTLIYRDRGEFVSMSDPAIVQLIQLDPLQIVFSVPASAMERLSEGQEVQIVPDRGQAVVGTIEFVAPALEAQSGTFRTRVTIPNPTRALVPGTRCLLRLP